MRALTPDIVAALKAGEMRVFLLYLMTIDGTDYAFTDCDIALVSDSIRYEPRGIDGGTISYGGGSIVDQVNIELDNLDDYLTPAFVGGTPQGSSVTMALAILDSDYAFVDDPVTLFMGTVGQWDINTEGVLSVTVTNKFAQWSQGTLGLHSASCRYQIFAGEYCKYSGSATQCDRTYTRCAALGNTANFGGFRWLPSIMDAQIWWGREQGESV